MSIHTHTHTHTVSPSTLSPEGDRGTGTQTSFCSKNQRALPQEAVPQGVPLTNKQDLGSAPQRIACLQAVDAAFQSD